MQNISVIYNVFDIIFFYFCTKFISIPLETLFVNMLVLRIRNCANCAFTKFEIGKTNSLKAKNTLRIGKYI